MYFSSKCCLFRNATLFGFCTTHILNTGVLKFEKKIRRQKVKGIRLVILDWIHVVHDVNPRLILVNAIMELRVP